MSDKIHQLLTDLYSEQAADELYRRIRVRIESARTLTPTIPPRERYTGRDVVLITYGDSITKRDEIPLRTLNQFANDYLSDFISAIHILPFYPYSSDDGFSVIDFYQVNPKLGTWPDVEAISRDFTLMVDAVFNHMSARSDWFKQFLAGDPEFAGLFMTESPETDLSQVTRPRATPLLTPYARPNGDVVHVWTTFSADQVDFDARTPDTLMRLLDILLFYIEKGAQIIRLDAIAYLWKIAGTSCIHLEQTHQVIQLMRAVLDEVAPQVLIITETNVPHAENVSYFGDGTNEAQLVYNFTLPPLLFHTLLGGDATRLTEWVNTLQTPSDRTTFFNFTASHDGIGVRPVEGILSPAEVERLMSHVTAQGGRVSYKQNPDGTTSPYELNISYFDAVTDPDQPIEQQVKRFLISQGIALVLAGMPAIYIHSLLGSRSDIAGMQADGQNRTINRAKLSNDAIRAALADDDTLRARVFNAYSHMIRIRRDQPAFHPNASQQAVDTGNPSLFVLKRRSADQTQTIVTVFNVSATPQTVDLSPHIGANPTDILTDRALTGQLTLAPYEMLWLEN